MGKRLTAQDRAEAARRAVAAAMKRLGLADPREALLCLPASYADCRDPQRVVPDEDDEDRRLYLLKLTGNFHGYASTRRRVANFGVEGWSYPKMAACKGGRCEIEMSDQHGNIVVWSQFGGAFQAMRDFGEAGSGDPVVLVGRMTAMGARRTVLEAAERVPARAIGTVWTRYSGLRGQIAGEVIESMALGQIDNPDAYRWCAAKLVGAVGMRDQEAFAAVRKDYDAVEFESFEQLLRTLHRPATPEEGWAARAMCNRLSALAIQQSAIRHHLRPAHPQAPLPIDMGSLDAIASTQPETLTQEQRAAIHGIADAFTSPKPLSGLLTGDVGTGKTLTYLVPAVAAQQAGAQVAIIAPTDLLANQIALQAIQRFGPLGVRIERVATGAKKLHDPSAILISTYGLVGTAKRCNYRPQVLICDEQHKMSAEAREQLVSPWTHLIEASATPIPRSLASALYGGMRTFTLLKAPVQKKINSFVYDLRDRPRGAAMLRWALETGQKAAVIYPRVEDGDDDAQSVLSGAQALEQAFPGKVAVLHGKLTDKEKQLAMEQIRSGEKPIVVGSTVMETGIDIPSMAGMIVRDADRFGASQLHQLRGRLVRNGGEGWFMMMVSDLETLPPDTRERLDAVAATTNGYELAEMDLLQRGFGDLDGTNQTGATDTVFRLVRLGPEDFLRNRIDGLDAQDRCNAPAVRSAGARLQVVDSASVSDRADRAIQPRLFA